MELVLHGLLWLAVLFRAGTFVSVPLRERVTTAFAADLAGGLAGVVLATAVHADSGWKLLTGGFGAALLICYAVCAARQLQPK